MPLIGFHDELEDPDAPGLMLAKLTADGDHPSIAGYRVLGELVASELRSTRQDDRFRHASTSRRTRLRSHDGDSRQASVTVVSCAAIVALGPTAASGSDGTPGIRRLRPVRAREPTRKSHARVSEEAAAAGMVEPNVEEAYERALATPRPRPAQRARATGPIRVPVYVHVIQDSAGGRRSAAAADHRSDQRPQRLASTAARRGRQHRRRLRADRHRRDDQPELVADSRSTRPRRAAMKTALREGGARALNLYVVDLSDPARLGHVSRRVRRRPGDGRGGGRERVAPGRVRSAVRPRRHGHPRGRPLARPLSHLPGRLRPTGRLRRRHRAGGEPYFGCSAGDRQLPRRPGNDPVENFMDYSRRRVHGPVHAGQTDRMHDQTAAVPQRRSDGAPTGRSRPRRARQWQSTHRASDPDGDALTYAIGDQPDHGTLSGSGAALTYTPAAGYAGPDSFSVRATDVFGASDTATISVTVTPGGGGGRWRRWRRRWWRRWRRARREGEGEAEAAQALDHRQLRQRACELTADRQDHRQAAPARQQGRRAKKTFKLKPASAQAQANGSAKLRLKLAKSKQRKLLALLERRLEGEGEGQRSPPPARRRLCRRRRPRSGSSVALDELAV